MSAQTSATASPALPVYWTELEVAEHFRVPVSWFRKRRGQFAHVLINREVRYTREQVASIAATLTVTPGGTDAIGTVGTGHRTRGGVR